MRRVPALHVCYHATATKWSEPLVGDKQLSFFRKEKKQQMKVRRRRFDRAFKLEVLREIGAGKSVAEVARAREIHPALISKWRRELAQYPRTAFSGNGAAYKEQARIAQLERVIGQLTVENRVLKKALSRLEQQSVAR